MKTQEKCTNDSRNAAITAVERQVDGKKYLVKSVLAREMNVPERLFSLCEKRALREMRIN